MNRNTGRIKMNALEELSAALASVSDPGRMRKFLEELHTPAELKDMGLRWRLLKMLDRGHPQREIARRLKISLCKITRGSKILKTRGSMIRILIKDH
jgi:TrpR family trp operon transcriptional repressor